jgi:hypothetical protein
MPSIRTWHTYLGILIAPSVLFFTFTGALQIFSLHEAHDSYVPPQLLEKLASVHKDQVFAVKAHDDDHHEEHGADEHAAAPPEHEEEPAFATTLLKYFFLLVAVTLFVSTLLGLWLGLTHVRHKRAGWWLLVVGIIVPTSLAMLTLS